MVKISSLKKPIEPRVSNSKSGPQTAFKSTPSSKKIRFFSKKWQLWVTACSAIVLMLGASWIVVKFAFPSKDPKASISQSELIEYAKEHQANQEHEKVIELLQGGLPDFYSQGNTEALKIYVQSRTRIALPKNRHISVSIQLLQKIVIENPSDHQSLETLFALCNSSQQDALAVDYGRQLCDLQPGNLDARFSLAQVLIRQNNFEEAQTIASQLAAGDPTNYDVVRLAMDCMIRQKISDEKIEAWIEGLTSSTNPPIGASVNPLNARKYDRSKTFRDHQFLLAEALGDKENAKSILESLAQAQSTDHLVGSSGDLLLDALDALGKPTDALSVAEVTRANTETESNVNPQDQMELIYRYLQSGQYDELVSFVEQDVRGTNSYNEQVVAAVFLAEFFGGNQKQLPELAKEMESFPSRLANQWAGILKLLSSKNVDENRLIEATQIALRAYPSSPYLRFILGATYDSMKEYDLAIGQFRLATKIAPAWSEPRIRLAKIYMSRRDFQRAQMESATALRGNSKSPEAYDLLLASTVKLLQRNEMPSTMVNKITTSARIFLESLEKESARELLLAVIHRLELNADLADECVEKFVALEQNISLKEFEILESLVTSPLLQQKLDFRRQEMFGMSDGKIFQRAIQIAKESGESSALKYLSEVEVLDQPLPEFTRNLMVCKMLESIQSPNAKGNWMELASKHRANKTVLELAIVSRSVLSDFAKRRELIEWIKEKNPKGMTWQIEEVSLMLDEDPSEKRAAQAILKVHEIIKQVPTMARAYGLMAVGYQRVKQPHKSIETLEKGIQNCGNHPVLALRLAEMYLEKKEYSRAIVLAEKVHNTKPASFELRQRLVKILLDSNAFGSAAKALKTDLPKSPIDDDRDFAIVRAYALATAKSGSLDEAAVNEILTMLGELPAQSQRWFDLWIDTLGAEKVPNEVAMEGLVGSEKWCDFNSMQRRRQVSKAMRKIANRAARREEQEKNFQLALEMLQPVLDGTPTSTDRLIEATLNQRLGMTQKAIEIYFQVGQSKAIARHRAIALNNLAMLIVQGEDNSGEDNSGASSESLQRAEKAVRQAISLDSQPDYLDTLAQILEQSGKRADVIATLKNGIRNYPEHLGIRIRMIETLQAKEIFDVAGRELDELSRMLTSSNRSSTSEQMRIRKLREAQIKFDQIKTSLPVE